MQLSYIHTKRKTICSSTFCAMKELLERYAAYNVWANHKLIFAMESLEDTAWFTEVPSSFNTLYKTVLHIWDAESIWWQRMKLQERILIPSENFSGDFKELVSALLQQSRLWEDWVANASELSITHVFQYQDRKRNVFKMPIYQMVHHVFNHGTYHRGQLVNMLRQLGETKVPSTDFSAWARLKK